MYPNFRNFYLDKQAFYSRKIQCNMKRHNKGNSLHGSLDGHKNPRKKHSLIFIVSKIIIKNVPTSTNVTCSTHITIKARTL